jgi:hypothetical protein
MKIILDYLLKRYYDIAKFSEVGMENAPGRNEGAIIMGFAKVKTPPPAPEGYKARKCWKCSGTGFYCMGIHNGQPYSLTGFACHPCGGTGYKGFEKIKTPEQIARAEARAEKKRIKELAAYEAQRAEREAEEARKLAEQIRRDEELAYQINAEKSGSQLVGTPGARQEFTLTLEKFLLFNTRFGNIHIYLMRDAAGNRIVYKGQWIGSEGETIIAKATIKEHAIYQGEKQTVIQRLNIK